MKILRNYISTLVKSVVVIFTMVSVVSCQKNKDDNPQPQPAEPAVPANPVIGFWQGHYRFTGSLANHYMKVLVKAGGKARVYDMNSKTDTADAVKSDATWTFADNKLEVTIGNIDLVVFSGAINSNKWTGAWKINADVKGTFTQSK